MLLILSVLALVVYSCSREELLTNEVLEVEQDAAHVFTYQKSTVIDGQYIVIFKENTIFSPNRAVQKENYQEMKAYVADQAQKILQENRIAGKTILQTFAKTMQGIAVQLNDDELERLRLDNRVDYIEQDQTVSVQMGGPPGGGGSGGQTTPWGITRVNGGVNGTGLRAWVIDSGIDHDHPDLNVDVASGANFASGKSSDDGNGHGTHVAGTIAAIDNSVGVIGVAAGAWVVPVRVLGNSGSGSTSGVIAGVDHVAANAGSNDVANMSLGGGVSTTLDNAVIAAAGSGGCNCPFTLAAGNESDNANNHSPARANGPNVYTIASMTSTDGFSSFSNFGQPPVDYIDPGSSILSTYKGGGYATASGTSMAAPHAAGVLLLGNISNGGSVSGPGGNYTVASH